MQRIRLIDVARAAGVSTATASRALSGQAGVSSDLHTRIMAAAARLGYRGNWAAKALATNRSGLIGVAICSPSNIAFEILGALQQRLDEVGYASVVTFVPEPGARIQILAGLIGRRVEAIVYVGDPPVVRELESLASQQLAWIAIADGDEGDSPCVELGRAAGAELAARYLRGMNHEHFAVLGPATGPTARGVARALEGRRFVMEAYDSSADPNAVKRAVHGVLELPQAPTAIICSEDAVALTVLRECTLRGVRVPTDVSIVGFGDEPLARAALPSLTTVRPGPRQAGFHAAEAVLALLAGGIPEPCKPAVRLAIRESTGPAP